ncbi:MAG: Mur ligase family protein [Bacteroidota bacterium]|nr:Mur ligase family protein [Bacteroidota bacterium]
MSKYHFIAIGGSAMHSLAIALKENGHQISGSDDAIFDPSLTQLQKAEISPKQMGWYPEKINQNLDGVIVGMHAKKDNPELLAAQTMGVPIFSYPEFITHYARNKTRVVIAGSHGKTTITAMVLHVLNYHQKSVDYMIGAQLDGFDNSVYLSDNNEFILLEGDEYLSSPIDIRPKFHHYKPQIALISGIAWDHVNVFKTEADYNYQFKTFIDSITAGGVLVYNEQDDALREMVIESKNTIRKQPYSILDHSISDGVTYLETDEGSIPLALFGIHNLSNLSGAKWICQLIGIDEDDFYQAISSFKGASKRLERLVNGKTSSLFRDFAHAPSKVKATTQAVKEQFPYSKLIACLELHTYSSLDSSFIIHYRNSLEKADQPIVFYDPEALKIKNRTPISPKEIALAFDLNELLVFTEPQKLKNYLMELNYHKSVLLMMSSGNYGGISWEELKARLSLY